MSVKKQIEESFFPLYRGFEKIAKEIHEDLSSNGTSLESLRDSLNQPTKYKRLIAVRNWLNHAILWAILYFLLSLLSSCFVSGRTIQFTTPRIDIKADTATAYTWPYNTKYQ